MKTRTRTRTKTSKRTYRITIRRDEWFVIQARTEEEALDAAFLASWMGYSEKDHPNVLEHDSVTIGHTIEEEQGPACDRKRC
jgi:hypothetical protein